MEIKRFTDCVLLVDDDPINGFLNAQLISRLGVAKIVKTASNDLEAVEFIRQCCLSEEGEFNSMLIFLDTHSTTYHGTELLDLINSITYKVFEKVEVIILSSSKMEKVIEKGAESNIFGYIEKPLTSEKLQKVLIKNIEEKQAE